MNDDELKRVGLSPLNYSSFMDSAEGKGLHRKYNYVISTVGFSPGPAVLFVSALKNKGALKKALFLCTRETESKVDDIVSVTKLAPSEYDKHILTSKTDMVEPYTVIKKFVQQYPREKVFIDATAGTKPMTAAVILAGAILEIPIWYADYKEYIEEERRPSDKEEFPVKLDNPYKLLGELEERRAISYFNAGRYRQAAETFAELLDKITERTPGPVKALKILAEAYALWDEFFLEDARAKFDEFFELTDEMSRSAQAEVFSYTERDWIEKNKSALGKVLVQPEWKIVNLYSASLRNAEMKRYDIAVFLAYRTLEYLTSTVLKEDYDINPSAVDWAKIDDQTKEKFKNTARKFWGIKAVNLKNKIGLMEQVFLLHSLGDKLFRDDKLVGKIQQLSELRNKSIYTHDERPLSEEKFNTFINVLKGRLLEFFFRRKLDMNSMLNQIQFPKMRIP